MKSQQKAQLFRWEFGINAVGAGGNKPIKKVVVVAKTKKNAQQLLSSSNFLEVAFGKPRKMARASSIEKEGDMFVGKEQIRRYLNGKKKAV